jgi:hypothetical protein
LASVLVHRRGHDRRPHPVCMQHNGRAC